MDTLNIAMVGYLNTLPFEYGLKKLSRTTALSLLLDTPARCVDHFADGRADLALVPVGALESMTDYEICLDYCIGCDGPVRTVCLFSHDEPASWARVYLDTHSRTSRLLAQLIIKEHLGVEPLYAPQRMSQMEGVGRGSAALMIGDKVFDVEGKYEVSIDLGAQWKVWTGMPFVFAVWVKRVGVQIDLDAVNAALQGGIDHIPDLVQAHATSTSLSAANVESYIKDNLHYDYGIKQQESLRHFLHLIALGGYT